MDFTWVSVPGLRETGVEKSLQQLGTPALHTTDCYFIDFFFQQMLIEYDILARDYQEAQVIYQS